MNNGGSLFYYQCIWKIFLLIFPVCSIIDTWTLAQYYEKWKLLKDQIGPRQVSDVRNGVKERKEILVNEMTITARTVIEEIFLQFL